MRLLTFILSICFGTLQANAEYLNVSPPGISGSAPIAGAVSVSNIFNVDFTANLGTVITLDGLTATQTINGLRTTDQVVVQCLSTLPTGIAIGNAQVTAANTMSIRFVTGVLGNVALGSLSYRVTVIR